MGRSNSAAEEKITKKFRNGVDKSEKVLNFRVCRLDLLEIAISFFPGIQVPAHLCSILRPLLEEKHKCRLLTFAQLYFSQPIVWVSHIKAAYMMRDLVRIGTPVVSKWMMQLTSERNFV